ncbi:MAG TPA: alanine--glyoxylate aminotransferase family protein [Candidatus Poseidoniales archaeon]|nr:MAG TPA: alanine--glyoxylate aminotransferase family protein [Candidatus Poseidoniales archaeon]|tara:strand:- start:2464 stop:3648 length:1185 start_codon:yes stop_codon:yes gene_type:complete
MAHTGDCFLVPGPVRMNDACLQAMATPVMTARGPEFRQVMAKLNSGLRYAFNLSPSLPEMKSQSWTGEDGYCVVVVSGSGTAAMEMVIANRFRNNDLVLVPTNGKFGERVADICRQFCNVKQLKYDWGRSFDLYELEQQLERGCYEALLICHNETSSGITQDAEAIAEMCERHNVAFILDGITSVGGMPVHPEQWKAEAVVMGAQKCTAGPSGIAAIALNQHCIERIKAIHQQGDANPRYYLDLISALKKGDDDQTPWTPAINLAMGWSAALDHLREETNEARWDRCERMAKGVRDLFTDLGFVLLADDGQRSNSVTAILYPEGVDDAWRTALKDRYETQVIGAQDHLKGKMFRIGSMGETPVEEMIEGCKRMLNCFADFGVDLKDVDVESYFG